MLTDALGTFSLNQAITASAASTDVIDLGLSGVPPHGHTVPLRRNLAFGEEINLRVQVTQAFATLTSLAVALQTDDAEAFSAPITILAPATVLTASLVPGFVFPGFDMWPRGLMRRYARLFYTVTGSNATAGQISAFVTCAHQNNP